MKAQKAKKENSIIALGFPINTDLQTHTLAQMMYTSILLIFKPVTKCYAMQIVFNMNFKMLAFNLVSLEGYSPLYQALLLLCSCSKLSEAILKFYEIQKPKNNNKNKKSAIGKVSLIIIAPNNICTFPIFIQHKNNLQLVKECRNCKSAPTGSLYAPQCFVHEG